jgi:hypothetical protein
MTDEVQPAAARERKGGADWVSGVFSGVQGQDVLILYAWLLTFVLIFAVVYALTDILGRRLGLAAAAVAGAVTLLVTRAHAVYLSANLVRGVGAWPTAVIFTFLAWSALGAAPGAFYSVRWYRRRRAGGVIDPASRATP